MPVTLRILPMGEEALGNDKADGGFFMSDIASGLPNEREAAPFVDPWSKEPNHQGVVPVDALFIGSWDNYVGIDDIIP
jgi:hypothetical protein